MNLREVREAADFVNRHQMFVRDCKHLYNAHQQCQWCHSGRYYIESAAMAQHILATIDPSPGLPITADWLREEWGFEEIGVMDSDKFYLDHDYSHYLIILKYGIGVFYFDYDDGDLWPHDLHTRQQFSDLAKALNIQRRTKHAIEPKGCTCLDSPNMLYAPCSYCDKQRKDGAK